MNKSLDYLPLGAGAERELVAGLCRGEPASYRQLYDRFSPRVQRLLVRIASRSNFGSLGAGTFHVSLNDDDGDGITDSQDGYSGSWHVNRSAPPR